MRNPIKIGQKEVALARELSIHFREMEYGGIKIVARGKPKPKDRRGYATAEALTPEQRKANAVHAINKRWEKLRADPAYQKKVLARIEKMRASIAPAMAEQQA